MVVRIRLARWGTRNNPFYHVVAIRDKAAREAKPIEKLGEYDPIPRPRIAQHGPVQGWQKDGAPLSAQALKRQMERPVLSSGIEGASKPVLEKRIEWNVERIQYWLSVGAQPSKPVAKLLDNAGLIPPGKWYKGMYRKPDEQQATGEGVTSPPSSKILQKAQQSVEDKVSSVSDTVDIASVEAREARTEAQPNESQSR